MSQLNRAFRLRTLLSGALLLGAGAVQAAPLAFEQNLGQTDAQVAYFGRTADGLLFLTPSEIVLRLAEKPAEPKAAEPSLDRFVARPMQTRQHVLRIQPAGALAARLESAQPLESRSSYFRAGAAQISEVPHFGRVTYRGLYTGTDLVLRGDNGRWSYDFVLAPGADPAKIALRFAGAEALHLEADGSLRLDTPVGPVFQSAPFLYQEVAGQKVQVAGGFDLRPEGLVGFKVGAYDRERELVIDPTVSFRTCLGGFDQYAGADASDMAVTANGQAYFTGTTTAADFPHPGGAQGDGLESDAFVAKLDLAGNLHRATYFDLEDYDFGQAIALDASNNPVISGLKGIDYGSGQAFVAKLSTLLDQVLWFKTFGGNAQDNALDVAIDAGGNIFVGGTTESTDFCSGALAGKCTVKASMAAGDKDGFLVKLGPNGGISWATLAGGSNKESGIAVAVDGTGRPYLGGYAYQPGDEEEEVSDVFYSWVRRYPANGLSLGYNFTFGTTPDPAHFPDSAAINLLQDLAVDSSSRVVVTGYTNSKKMGATLGAVQPTLAGPRDAFVGMINSNGTGLSFLTYQGLDGDDYGQAIAVGDNGHIYVAGSWRALDTDGDWDNGPFNDVAIARYTANGASRLFYSTFGGSRTDHSSGLALDSARNMYIAGTTYSNDFDSGDAHCNALVTANNDGAAFAVKVVP